MSTNNKVRFYYLLTKWLMNIIKLLHLKLCNTVGSYKNQYWIQGTTRSWAQVQIGWNWAFEWVSHKNGNQANFTLELHNERFSTNTWGNRTNILSSFARKSEILPIIYLINLENLSRLWFVRSTISEKGKKNLKKQW